MGFCEATYMNYDRGPHLELVAGELEKIADKKNDRLMIFMPPRHGKTELVSIRFPAWLLCKKPQTKIISAC